MLTVEDFMIERLSVMSYMLFAMLQLFINNCVYTESGRWFIEGATIMEKTTPHHAVILQKEKCIRQLDRVFHWLCFLLQLYYTKFQRVCIDNQARNIDSIFTMRNVYNKEV